MNLHILLPLTYKDKKADASYKGIEKNFTYSPKACEKIIFEIGDVILLSSTKPPKDIHRWKSLSSLLLP
jgi:hypothetical protein